ncbi:MAG: hypothetical protein IPP44_12475 [Ideonella sp.]|nr:hypothetical protein [Ideonella sp.]
MPVTFAAVRAHSLREDVVAAAAAVRCGADPLGASGAVSVIDAAKAVQLCSVYGLTPGRIPMSPTALVRRPNPRARPRRRPMRSACWRVSTTLSASEFTAMAASLIWPRRLSRCSRTG